MEKYISHIISLLSHINSCNLVCLSFTYLWYSNHLVHISNNPSGILPNPQAQIVKIIMLIKIGAMGTISVVRNSNLRSPNRDSNVSTIRSSASRHVCFLFNTTVFPRRWEVVSRWCYRRLTEKGKAAWRTTLLHPLRLLCFPSG